MVKEIPENYIFQEETENPINDTSFVAKKIEDFARIVQKEGGRAFLVGGAARDEIMGREIKDYDIEIYGLSPEKVRNITRDFFKKYDEVGASFGVLKTKIGETDIDISLPRKESKTGAGHKDFSINVDINLSLEEALERRDFTINALAKDIITNEIYDYFGGLDDIKNRILRVVSKEKFKEDPLRALRAVQFVGRFGLMVEEETSRLIREIVPEMKHLSRERLREEWVKLFLKSEKPSLGLQTAMEWGIFHYMHPEITVLPLTPQDPQWHPEGDVWIHTLKTVDEASTIVREEHLPDRDALIVLLAAFCHDFGKILTTKEEGERITSRGHEKAGIELADKFLFEIGIEKSLREPILKLISQHMKPSIYYVKETQKEEKITDGAIRKLASRIYPATIKQLIFLAKADHFGRGYFLDPSEPEKSFISRDYPAGNWLLERARQLDIFENKPSPILFGRDLIALGFEPSPAFGKIIKLAEELHVKGKTREEVISSIARLKDEGKSLEEIISFFEKLEKDS